MEECVSLLVVIVDGSIGVGFIINIKKSKGSGKIWQGHEEYFQCEENIDC